MLPFCYTKSKQEGLRGVKVKIQIDTHTFVRFLLATALFIGAMFVFWRLLPVLLIIAVSFFLAIALNTPVSKLARHIPGHSRILASALAYIMVLAIIGSFLFLAVPPVVRQTNIFLEGLPTYIQEVGSQRSFASHLVNQYHLKDVVDQFVHGVQSQAGDIARGVGTNVVNGVTQFINGFVTVLTVLVLTFMMLIEGPHWLKRLWDLYHDKALLERHQKLVHRMYQVVVSYVNGQVLVAAISALTTAATLIVLANFFKVPYPAILPLSLAVLITALIPMIGTTLGAIIVTIVLLFNDFGAALIFTVYFLIYQQIENNVIQPTVQSRTVELTALTVLVSVIVGVVLIGPAGGFLAVPVAGCIRVLLLDYLEHRSYSHQRAAHREA